MYVFHYFIFTWLLYSSGWPQTLILPAACHLLHDGITGVHYVVLGMELRALCMLGKCFTN